jgi:hypothetical protein
LHGLAQMNWESWKLSTSIQTPASRGPWTRTVVRASHRAGMCVQSKRDLRYCSWHLSVCSQWAYLVSW